MRRRLLLAGAVLLTAPATAPAADGASSVPGKPPAVCASPSFVDEVLTNGEDSATTDFRATRLYGLAGDDDLTGSPTRATCLFGGRGDDRLTLRDGGGIAFGEAGSDILFGSPLADYVDGGPGVDAFGTGAGDDVIASRDGRAEVVDCGPGDDTVRGDRADVLLGCETARMAGPRLPRARLRPREVGYRGIPKLTVRVPAAGTAGTYRVVLLTGKGEGATPGCTGGPKELTRFPARGRRVRARQRVRVGIRPPKGGFCRGPQKAVLLRAATPGGPPEALARLSFRVRPRALQGSATRR